VLIAVQKGYICSHIKYLMKKYSYWAIYILSGSAVLIFCLVGIPRFLYPYEVHWLEGSMVDQIARIHSGNPLYSRPSMEYVPWLYGEIRWEDT
jgi:hypothetical protein